MASRAQAGAPHPRGRGLLRAGARHQERVSLVAVAGPAHWQSRLFLFMKTWWRPKNKVTLWGLDNAFRLQVFVLLEKNGGQKKQKKEEANKCHLAHVNFKTVLWAHVGDQAWRDSVFYFLYQRRLFNLYIYQFIHISESGMHLIMNVGDYCIITYFPQCYEQISGAPFLCLITYWVVII